MKSWRSLLQRRPASTSQDRVEPPRDTERIAELEERLRDAEESLESARRSVVALQIEMAAVIRRSNAHVDLTEQRLDLIYRRVTEHLARAMDMQPVTSETEAEIDARLATLLSKGLRAEIDPATLAMDQIVSDRLRPGELRPPLTLYGFRIDRRRARERGDGIEILGLQPPSFGTALYGPYKRLIPGNYRVTFHISAISSVGSRDGEIALDVYSPGSDAILGEQSTRVNVEGTELKVAVEFTWSSESAKDTVEFRLHQRSSVAALVTSVRLEAL